MKVDTAYKYPTNNSLNLTYIIEPSAPLIVLNNYSTDLTSLLSIPGSPGVTITAAEINPDTNELVVHLDYT